MRSTGCKAAAALLALLASITGGAAEPPATPTASATLTPLQAKAREIFERVIAFKSIAPGYETPQLVDYLAGELRTAGFA